MSKCLFSIVQYFELKDSRLFKHVLLILPSHPCHPQLYHRPGGGGLACLAYRQRGGTFTERRTVFGADLW